jgi:hypothetical protein
MDAQTAVSSRVGPVFQADGTTPLLRAAETGDLIVQMGRGKYCEAVLRGNVYSGMTATTGVGADELVTVVTVCCRRYAVEDDQDRHTLDCCVYTDRADHLGYGVLEYKSTQPDATPPGRLARLGLRPLKLSKYLWETEV